LKKIYYFYIFILLLLLSAIYIMFPTSFAFNYDRGDSILAEAFEASGAKIVESNINVYSSSQDMFLGKDELTGIVKFLAAQMEVDFSRSEKEEHYEEGYNKIALIGNNVHGQSIVLIGHSMDFAYLEDEEEGVETNIVLDFSSEDNYENISKIGRKAKGAVDRFIKGARVTSCIIGSFEDEISRDQMIEIINSILEEIGAKEVERAVCDGMISISGYTPRIGEHLKIGENRVNINIAMRYNSYERKTYIWIGSPVISLEY